jgi:hypothetical protein
MCCADVATCHLHGNQCPDDHFWISVGYEYSDGSECTCSENRNSGPTQFGLCYNTATQASTCSIAKNDCTDDEDWFEPAEALYQYDTECGCHDVQTGACYDTTTHATSCAVDSDSCDSSAVWITARDASETYGMSCVLCGSPTAAPTSAPTAAPNTAAPIPGPTSKPTTAATQDVDLTLSLRGISCTDYGNAEEAVVNDALAAELDGSQSFSAHVCMDATRRRGLLSTSVSIATTATVTKAAYDDDDIEGSVTSALTSAVDSGSLESSIASGGVSSLASISVTGVSVEDDDTAADSNDSIAIAIDDDDEADMTTIIVIVALAALLVVGGVIVGLLMARGQKKPVDVIHDARPASPPQDAQAVQMVPINNEKANF